MASLIDAPRGADLLLSYIFPDDTDLGGYGAALTVYGERNGTVLLTVGVTPTANGSAVSAVGNLLSLVMRAADIDALPVNGDDSTLPALLWFDLIVTTPAPQVCKLYGGLMRILPYGAQITPEGGFIEVAVGDQPVMVEVAQSGFDTAVLALAEGYATAAQVSAEAAAGAAGAAAEQAGIATGQAAASAGSASASAASAANGATWASGAVVAEAGAASSAASASGSAAIAVGSATAAVNAATSLSTLLTTSLVLRPMAAESGYLFAAVDANQRAAFGVTVDGSFTAFKYASNSIPGNALAAGAVTTSALTNGSVTYTKLDATTVGQFLAQTLPPESGYIWGVLDAAKKLSIGILQDGTFIASKMVTPTKSIDFPQLTPNLSAYVATSLPPESGFVWGVLDGSKKLGLGIGLDGTVVGKFTGLLSPGSVTTAYLGAGAVTEAKLDPVVDRLAVPHVTDVVEVTPDKWRGQYGTIAARTSTEGTYWTQFPRVLTQNMRGKNVSGTAIQLRRSAGLQFRGIRDGAVWSPNANAAIASTNYLGQLLPGFAVPTTSGRSVGDYYRYAGTTAVSFDSQMILCGDLVVFDGTNWRAQLAPRFGVGPTAPQNNRLEQDFWEVSAVGTFDAVTYLVGDKIVHIGFDSESGNGQALWYKGKGSAGELFYKGEFAPGTASLPSSPGLGDVYQASAAGTDTTTGLMFSLGDYAVYDHYPTWGTVSNGAIITVPNNAMMMMACTENTAEWEVRRGDKSETVVGVTPTILHQMAPRRSVDTVLLLSDSMFGVPNIQPQLQALVTPRNVNLITRGGGTSRNVMSTYEWYVATQADPYQGEFTFIWHGQNNQPSAMYDTNWCQIAEASLQLRNLLGSRDKRYCFLSVLGQNTMSFDGTRIHVSQHEAMFTQNVTAYGGVLWQLEQWYATMFPGQWVSPRLALLAAAANSIILDARYPGSGMTEAQTAAAYGWVPLSFWSSPTGGWPIPLGNLSLKGYWNSNSLPTGGGSGDCYTISGGALSAIGALAINVAGTWGVYAADTTHQGSGFNQGGQYLAAALANFLSTNVL